MLDAAVEAGEERGGFGWDHGGFEVGTGKVADGFEGTPVGFDDDFDFVFTMAKRNRRSQVAWDAAKLGQNVLGKMLEIFWQLRFGGTSGPAPQDGSGCKGRGRRARLIANDNVPEAGFPFFDVSVDDIWIFMGEGFDFGFVIHVENNQGRGSLRKGSGKNDFATFTSLVGEAQVLLAEWRAASDKVIDNFVEQSVVVHLRVPFPGKVRRA